MSEVAQTQEKDLFEILPEVFSEVLKNREHQREIDDTLYKKHRIPHGVFGEVLLSSEKFFTLPKEEQGAILSVISEVTKDERVLLENFYNSKEINKIKKFKKELNIGATLPHTFGNYVIRTSDEDYNTSVTYKEVVSLYVSGILDYSLDIQRNPKEVVDKKTGEMHREARVIKRSITEMTELMKKHRFRSNQLTLLVLVDDLESTLSYNDGELTLETGKMYIIDGFHRLSAMMNILEEDPDYHKYTDVAVKHLTFDEARHYLGQINKMTKVDKSFVKSLMVENIWDKIVVDIKRKSVLGSRITDDATVSKYKSYLTSFSVLSRGIEDIFQPKDNVDRINISEVLVNFFDYVLDYYKEDFSKDLATLKASREKTLRNYHNTFVLYLVFAKKLFDKYGKNIPSDQIVKLIDSVDFTREEGREFYDVLYREGSGKVNSNRVKKEIQAFAEQKADLILSEK